MKVKIEKAHVAFEPVTLVLTLETPEEVQALYDLANHRGNIGRTIREKVQVQPASSPNIAAERAQRVLGEIYDVLHDRFGSLGLTGNRIA